jgi:hypothetical protein
VVDRSSSSSMAVALAVCSWKYRPRADNPEQSARASAKRVTKANNLTEHIRLGDAHRKQDADGD